MNQFIAIMKESLWSTLATKLLYFEILAVVLVLAALSPLSFQEQVRYEILRNEVRQPAEMIKVWVASADQPEESVGKTLWENLTEAHQAKLREISVASAEPPARGPGSNRRYRAEQDAFMQAANYLIKETRLWDDPTWGERIDNRQTKRLWEQRATLSDDYLKRLNRMLIQEGLRGQLESPPESSAGLTYAGIDLAYTLPMSGVGLAEVIRLWLPFVLDKLFLTIGVLLAILVTSTAIPQMLEEGSLYLLLSKPQSRLFLLLSKYIGSGILILIISSVFLTGVWLILGTRFNVWMVEVLWCIPLALVIFLVYYSVTVGVGLMFRNVILSIIATIMFAGTCYLLSFSRYSYSGLVAFQRTAEVQMVGDTIVRRSAHNHSEFYDAASGKWELGLYALANDMPPEMFATMSGILPSTHTASPAYLADKQLYIGELQFFPPRPDLPKRLAVARRGQPQELAKPHILGELPFGCLGFWTDQENRLHAVTSYGTVVRLNELGEKVLADAAQGKFPAVAGAVKPENEESSAPATSVEPLPSSEEENPAAASVASAAATVPSDAEAEEEGAEEEADDATDASVIANQGENGMAWTPMGNIAFDAARSMNRIVFDRTRDTCYSLGRTTLSRAKRNSEGVYQVETTVAFPWEWTQLNRVPLGLLREMLIIPLRGSAVVVLDAETLEPVADLQLPRPSIPLSLSCDESSGTAVVTYANGEMWLFDAATKTLMKKQFVKNATSASFDAQGQLVVAHGVDDLSIVQLPSGTVTSQLKVQKNLIRNIYDWGVEPIYSVFPKPNECYVLIQHLANQGSVDANRNETSPPEINIDAISVQTDNPWSPILSSGIFALVLMLFNCLYFWRQEF
jgi:ABC-type transport system involved in multi-copper enzyme maturation permease subunit